MKTIGKIAVIYRPEIMSFALAVSQKTQHIRLARRQAICAQADGIVNRIGDRWDGGDADDLSHHHMELS